MNYPAHLILRNLNVLQYYSKEKRDLLEYQIEQFKLPAELLTKEIQKILAESVFDLSTMSALTNSVQRVKNIFNGLMAIPNMIALFALSGVVYKETKKFLKAIGYNSYVYFEKRKPVAISL